MHIMLMLLIMLMLSIYIYSLSHNLFHIITYSHRPTYYCYNYQSFQTNFIADFIQSTVVIFILNSDKFSVKYIEKNIIDNINIIGIYFINLITLLIKSIREFLNQKHDLINNVIELIK